MIGKVIINANGEKAISFDDAAWAALPVGATIYAERSVKLPPTEYFGDSWSGGWAITRENIVDCLEEHGIKVEDE
jgi:hypothetical protein